MSDQQTAHKITAELDDLSDDNLDQAESAGGLVQGQQIDVRQTILQGSFLPVTLVASKGLIDVNEFIVEGGQRGKLVHYLGHFGKIKALRTFYERFQLDLEAEDSNGQTIVHYAARQGELGVLLYLQDFPQVSLGKANKFNITPVVYTMCYQRVYSFIFLYFKKGLHPDINMCQWAVTEMVKGSAQTEILQLLLHVNELKEVVMKTAVQQAISLGNLPVLKMILKREYKNLDLEILVQAAADSKNEELKAKINKYHTKKLFDKNGVCCSLLKGGLCLPSILRLAAKKLAPIIGVLINLLTNVFFLAVTFGRHMDPKQKLINQITKDPLSKWPLIACIILTFQSSMFLILSLSVGPGYVKQKTLADNDNVITTLCKEFETRSAKGLTQLDELCLDCLCVKFMHVEHCKKCGRCVKHFHMHSRYYNKCIGEDNIRPYVLFIINTIVLSILFVWSLLHRAWQSKELKASNCFFRFLEMHVRDGYFDLACLILAELYVIKMIDTCITILSAISRGMTINEMQNTWNYKYLFEARRGRSQFSTGTYYYYKNVTFCKQVCNLIKFFCSCGGTSALKLHREKPQTEETAPLQAVRQSDDIELQEIK